MVFYFVNRYGGYYFFKNLLIFSPVSKYLSYFWNYGSFLGLLVFFQILTGFMLVFYYIPEGSLSFFSVQYISREVSYGWLIRSLHFNGASFIFFLLYIHMVKALFFCSFRLKSVWFTGLLIWYLMSAIAFTGYVLGWSQMSYWAAVVITSLLSVVPYLGWDLLLWVWGGFSVNSLTLKFFFTLHFLLPFVILFLVLLHLVKLHSYGSTSVLGYSGMSFKIHFWPYYWVKDLMNLVPFVFIMLFILSCPFLLGDPEMFVEANSLLSPIHILPEWYFLSFYAILRVIPNKFLGVMFLILGLLIPFVLGVFNSYLSPFFVFINFLVYLIVFNFIFLSWLGQCPVEDPYLFFMVFSVFFYFFFFFFCYWFLNLVIFYFFKCF